MKPLCDKYAAKLVAQKICDPGTPIIGGLDADLVWNHDDDRNEELAKVFEGLTINSLVFARPAEPYATIVDFLASRYPGTIRPEDTETRTFLHDIPVADEFSAEAIIKNLKRRKSVIIPGEGIVSYGTVTPEQGFVFYSSTIFSCFVLFFSDYLAAARRGEIDDEYRTVFRKVVAMLPEPRQDIPSFIHEGLGKEDIILEAMAESGRYVVSYGLVDSFFGNISYRHGNTVYISQTGSSLDELKGCIDPCPMDNSTTHGLTASSELSAHEDVYRRADVNCILHGHPKFSVIMSMDCDKVDCPNRGQCHIKCTECRTVEGVPIVPGEVGTGPTGLCNTLPPAIAGPGAAIVHGHGLFTTGVADFEEAFVRMLETENRCRELYFERLKELGESI
ncbi:class II aldolase/adducin family protein [Pseudodesulfovibrio sp. zrk46]|uniref:class II aldolase/adducin family protein n=1 Tax=Pseudodesulfovibrio sp. zrk46 TaxID=2725288 RepID=UPI001448ACCB|nr:class II aldolase/adducin family protein [Pseudodesulfovibrio sp. zrk46]QJB54882.1 rRNA adenine dimethylase [Pseudodesulfovibrio sp. zrk46]